MTTMKCNHTNDVSYYYMIYWYTAYIVLAVYIVIITDKPLIN